MIKYKYAKDSAGETIDIDCVSRDSKDKHYYCIGCSAEMSPVLGNVNTHHFRHKDEHCSRESYLHKLGKSLLKKRFETSERFEIKFNEIIFCNSISNCLHNKEPIWKNPCHGKMLQEIDLKQYYDTCEEEVTYKGFRADLMLSNSKDANIPPIFLEISVTHDCEKEKIESGIRIIELKINSEKDITCIITEKINDLSSESVRGYNFSRRMFPNDFPFVKFEITDDEKGVLRGNLSCQIDIDNHNDESIYEILMFRTGELKFDYLCFWLGLFKANKKGVPIRYCGICSQKCKKYIPGYKINYAGVDRKVRYQTQKIHDSKIDKFAKAAKCTRFSVDEDYANKFIQLYQELIEKEWVKDDLLPIDLPF